MQELDAVFYIIILIISVILHEISHGYVAEMFGDPTARNAGRLTLNPIKHLDPFGSVILPFIMIVAKTGFVFGWAKPVPYNPNNLRNKRWGTLAIASAGIFANLLIAVLFALGMRILTHYGIANEHAISLIGTIVFLNILLAVFNLVPIPPLDGSKILFSLLPARFHAIEAALERYGFILLIVFLVFIWQYFAPAIFFIFTWLTGIL
jgi:Zn-dependent protease